MRSVKHEAAQTAPVVQEIMRCLQVNSSEAYLETAKRLDELTDPPVPMIYGFLTQMCARFSPSRSAAPWEEGADALVPANQR